MDEWWEQGKGERCGVLQNVKIILSFSMSEGKYRK